MSRISMIFAMAMLVTGMSACSSFEPSDRSTASDESDAKLYRPTLGETRHFE